MTSAVIEVEPENVSSPRVNTVPGIVDAICKLVPLEFTEIFARLPLFIALCIAAAKLVAASAAEEDGAELMLNPSILILA